MNCEMCGNDVPSLRRAIVEGTEMRLCGNCVRFGVEVAGHATEVTGRSKITETLERRARRMRSRDVFEEHKDELVLDFGERIQKARQRKGLSFEELGKRIAERVSILHKVEAGSHHPSDDLAKRLERELGITLLEKPESILQPDTAKKDVGRALTLGDMLKEKLRKE